jgi:hypothetical protein
MRKQNRRHEGAIVQESTILSQAVPSISGKVSLTRI